VAPFKPQNMSNNAAVTADGGEIGRAQALQARPPGAPRTDMNPVLLKPETDTGAQVIVQGRASPRCAARITARQGAADAAGAGELRRLAAGADLVIVEGAGSPAEVNLRAGDIANMGFAEAAACRSCWPGDIDRGGVIAQIVGTQAVLPAADAALDQRLSHQQVPRRPALFDDGVREIVGAHGWPGFGVLPWFAGLAAAGRGRAGHRLAPGRGVSHRLPRAVADREFRRSRPAGAGGGRAADHAGPGARAARRCRPGDPAGHEIHAG
jgi:adenosylcobyric acid synthase